MGKTNAICLIRMMEYLGMERGRARKPESNDCIGSNPVSFTWIRRLSYGGKNINGVALKLES
jgi:hypothetical protein